MTVPRISQKSPPEIRTPAARALCGGTSKCEDTNIEDMKYRSSYEVPKHSAKISRSDTEVYGELRINYIS